MRKASDWGPEVAFIGDLAESDDRSQFRGVLNDIPPAIAGGELLRARCYVLGLG